ncbi:polysaccharide deacetylase family protein [Candidatus Micrarchaeota archaeon]|nr:polysaccharide deacetylase family protein [Candidatus Micrarchaeota archaeon]
MLRDKNIVFGGLFDPRSPIYSPMNVLRWNALSKKLDSVEIDEHQEIDFLFTVDVEYDYGSAGSGQTLYSAPYLDKARDFFAKNKISPTLFVQGDLIASLAPSLKRLESDGIDLEVGLHGYAHENWGRAWFTQGPVPNSAQRRELLNKSLDAFERAKIEPPKSFRAPNMVADNQTLSLLQEYGFSTDSSPPSYTGTASLVTKWQNLIQIPVTTDPMPFFSKFAIAHYNVFNTYNVVLRDLKTDIVAAATRVAKLQILNGQKPFIVFLSHPWEFFECSEDLGNEFTYSSANNFSKIEGALSELKKSFRMNFMTMKNFAKNLRN